MPGDEGDGQVGGVLHEADESLREHHPEEHPHRASGLGCGGGAAHDQHQGHREPDQQEDGVGVQLGDLGGGETVAGGVDVAGVRAGTGHDRAEVEHRPPRDERRDGQG